MRGVVQFWCRISLWWFYPSEAVFYPTACWKFAVEAPRTAIVQVWEWLFRPTNNLGVLGTWRQNATFPRRLELTVNEKVTNSYSAVIRSGDRISFVIFIRTNLSSEIAKNKTNGIGGRFRATGEPSTICLTHKKKQRNPATCPV